MSAGKKTDNHSLSGKLDLRRHFLAKYHCATPPRVIDCCQGSGKLWQQLRREFPVASYWGMDLKPKSGRMKIDSARVLVQKGWVADIVDVDAYGSPWEHWLALLPNMSGPLTVFLTVGIAKGKGGATGGSVTTNVEKTACGLDLPSLGLCPSILGSDNLREHILARMLSLPMTHGLRIVEAAEAPPGKNARYFGLRLVPGL